jgi:hypothetical protein
LEGFVGLGWMVVLTHLYQYVKSLAFMGLMVGGILHHCVWFTWALVEFTTKGHEMIFLFLLGPIFTLVLLLFD